MIQNKEPVPKGFHNLSLENRNILTLTGITDVDSFDENSVVLYTQLGEVTIHGKDLHINSMNTDTGNLDIEGDIWSIIYGDKDKRKAAGFLSKLFR